MGFSVRAITSAVGGIKSVRSVLDRVPTLSNLTFPPQVQVGIKVAGVFGINLPSSPAELASRILGRDIDKNISSLKGRIDSLLNGALGKIDKLENTIKDITRIDWLL